MAVAFRLGSRPKERVGRHPDGVFVKNVVVMKRLRSRPFLVVVTGGRWWLPVLLFTATQAASSPASLLDDGLVLPSCLGHMASELDQ